MNVSIREFNILREGLCGYNPELKVRPLTRYFNMKSEQIQKMFELHDHIIPQSFLNLLCIVPDGKTATELHKEVTAILSRAMSMRKNKPNIDSLVFAVEYIKRNAGKMLAPTVKLELQSSNITPPAGRTAPQDKPKLPVPESYTINKKLAEKGRKVDVSPAPAPPQAKKEEPAAKDKELVITSYVTDFPLVVDISALKKGHLKISMLESGTAAPKPGDGRIVIPAAARKDIPSEVRVGVR